MSEIKTSLAGGGRVGRAFYFVARALVVGFMLALTRVRVVGKENVPREGGAVLALNHFHWLDPAAFGVASPRHDKFAE